MERRVALGRVKSKRAESQARVRVERDGEDGGDERRDPKRSRSRDGRSDMLRGHLEKER